MFRGSIFLFEENTLQKVDSLSINSLNFLRPHSVKYSCLKKVDSITTNCSPHFEMRVQDNFASFAKLLRRITALYIDCSSSLEEVYALYTLLFSTLKFLTLKGVDALYTD